MKRWVIHWCIRRLVNFPQSRTICDNKSIQRFNYSCLLYECARSISIDSDEPNINMSVNVCMWLSVVKMLRRIFTTMSCMSFKYKQTYDWPVFLFTFRSFLFLCANFRFIEFIGHRFHMWFSSYFFAPSVLRYAYIFFSLQPANPMHYC